MAARFGEMEFSMEGGEGCDRVEGVATFRYLGRTLDQTDDNCPAVQRNIICARSVWGGLGTLIIQEGTNPRVAEIFYRAVAQAILMYGFDMWVHFHQKDPHTKTIH